MPQLRTAAGRRWETRALMMQYSTSVSHSLGRSIFDDLFALSRLPPQDTHLMSQANELEFQGASATKPEGEDGNDGGKNCDIARDGTAGGARILWRRKF